MNIHNTVKTYIKGELVSKVKQYRGIFCRIRNLSEFCNKIA